MNTLEKLQVPGAGQGGTFARPQKQAGGSKGRSASARRTGQEFAAPLRRMASAFRF